MPKETTISVATLECICNFLGAQTIGSQIEYYLEQTGLNVFVSTEVPNPTNFLQLSNSTQNLPVAVTLEDKQVLDYKS